MTERRPDPVAAVAEDPTYTNSKGTVSIEYESDRLASCIAYSRMAVVVFTDQKHLSCT